MVPRGAAGGDDALREQLSALGGLLVLSNLLTRQDDEAGILHLVASAVESLGHCRTERIRLDGRWTEVRVPQHEPSGGDLDANMPPDGVRFDLAGVPWSWAYSMWGAHGASGCLVVGAGQEPAEGERFLLQVLAQQAGVALANARLHAREREQAEQLRVTNLALQRTSGARCAVLGVEQDLHAYVHYLEERLQLSVFSRGAADPEAAVLLVRGALAADDPSRATELAAATEQLAAARPGNDDMAAAGTHARGLIEQDPATLERAAKQYSSPLGRAWAAEDAGAAWAQRGNSEPAVARLREAHALYRQLDAADSAARVRAQLLATGIRVRHWRRADRPAFGWESLTETEQRVVHLVARGLSNRQVASQMYLSIHTIAFHLRRIYCKLDLTSRVQLATLATERGRLGTDG